MYEWIWRVLFILLASYFYRVCACTVVALLLIRKEECSNVWDLERFLIRARAMTVEERRAMVAKTVPLWFRIIFLWRL